MNTHLLIIAPAALTLAAFSCQLSAFAQNPTADSHTCRHAAISPPVVSPPQTRLDARVFFEQLVERYRSLRTYSDITSIVQTTQRVDDAPAHRTETRIHCELRDGRLEIRTPAVQPWRAFGLKTPMHTADHAEHALSQYNLWLLPHMALKFSEHPLADFRTGVPEGFIATDAAAITMDVGGTERSMVHLELKSAVDVVGAHVGGPEQRASGRGFASGGSGSETPEHEMRSLSGSYTARYDIYVDPESMLIERIESEQRLPEGMSMHTSYVIRPQIPDDRADDPQPHTPSTPHTTSPIADDPGRSASPPNRDDASPWPDDSPPASPPTSPSTSPPTSPPTSPAADEPDPYGL